MDRPDVLDRVAEEQSLLIERSNFEPPFTNTFNEVAAWFGQRLRDNKLREASASGEEE